MISVWPYAQVWQPICTSGLLRASIKVSSGFALIKHSSPPFGSEPYCSCSAAAGNERAAGRCCADAKEGWIAAVSQLLRCEGLWGLVTCSIAQLLSTFFKTGQSQCWKGDTECTLPLGPQHWMMTGNSPGSDCLFAGSFMCSWILISKLFAIFPQSNYLLSVFH